MSAGAKIDHKRRLSGGSWRCKSSPPPERGSRSVALDGCPVDAGGIYKVELYGRIRRAALVDGQSQRAVAREYGIFAKRFGRCWRMQCRPGISAIVR